MIPPNIIFDGQILQTDAWYRGMGRYCLQLLNQLNEESDGFNLYIIFNSNINCEQERFAEIERMCPNIKQIKLNLPITSDPLASESTYKQRLDTLIEERFRGQDNYYVITSLFTFNFYAQYPTNCRKILLFYDLTPLMFWKDLGAYFPPWLYMKRFRQIYEAESILTISNVVREDVIRTFGFSRDRVTSINGGFTKPKTRSKKPAGFNPGHEYVLFVSGDLPHKNNELAAKGYAKFVEHSGTKAKLVVTSTFSKESRQRLSNICPSLIFSGNVTDEELEWLYQNAGAVLFASKYEGLGIPILDAVYNHKPVIASKIPVFQEMSEKAFYLFPPDNAEALAVALNHAINRDGFSVKHKQYKGILERYSWENTARGFIASLKGLEPQETFAEKRTDFRKRVAVLAIHPGVPGQIGRSAEPLHYWLAKSHRVDYYFDSCGLNITQMERPTFLDEIDVSVSDIAEFTTAKYKEHDEVIYLLDDKSLRYKIARFAAVLPGVAVCNFSSKKLPPELHKIKKLILDNQKYCLNVKNKLNFSEISSWLNGRVAVDSHRTPSEMIIRRGHWNSVIMNKLLRNLSRDR